MSGSALAPLASPTDNVSKIIRAVVPIFPSNQQSSVEQMCGGVVAGWTARDPWPLKVAPLCRRPLRPAKTLVGFLSLLCHANEDIPTLGSSTTGVGEAEMGWLANKVLKWSFQQQEMQLRDFLDRVSAADSSELGLPVAMATVYRHIVKEQYGFDFLRPT
jgi:hypothetical protein